MPIARRALGAGLAGLGSALAGYGESRIKRRDLEAHQQATAQAAMEAKRLEVYLKLHEDLAADPTKYEALAPVAQSFGLPLQKPSDDVLLRKLTGAINDAPDRMKLPANVGAAAEAAGVPALPAADPMTGAGAQFADPSAPFASTTAMNTPKVRDLSQLAMDKRQSFDTEDARGIDQKRQEAAATTTGTNEAQNANFPTVLAQKGQEQQQQITGELQKARQMIPIAAQQAGATAGAGARALLAPDIVQGKADEASRVATAQAANKPVDDKTRQTVSFFIRATNAANNATATETSGFSPWRGTLPAVVQGDQVRQYNQAVDEFALSVLRKESGAAISPSEHAQFAKTYFQQPNDDPGTIKRKQEARARVLEGLKFEAQTGLPEFQKFGNSVPQIVKPGSTLNKLLENP